jgi:hypothetical protein
MLIKIIMVPFFLRTDTPKYIYASEVDKTTARAKIIQANSFIYSPESLEGVTNETLNNYEKQESQGSAGFGALFSTRYRTRLLSGCFVAFAQQISGINFLIFYSTKLFEKSGKAKEMTVTVGLANFLGSFVALYAIGKFGRKFNIVWGTLLQGIGMLLLFIGFRTDSFGILAAAVVIYMLFFAVGLGGSEMAYISEILPPAGVSIALAVQWILTAAIAQSLLSLMNFFGPNALLIFFTGACFLFFFAADYLMIETKDKNEEMIAQEFENREYKFLNFK